MYNICKFADGSDNSRRYRRIDLPFQFMAVFLRQVDINLMQEAENLDISDYIESNQWKVVDTSATRNVIHYACCNESAFVDITFGVTLERYSTFALHLFLGPSVALSLVIPTVFIMPAGSNQKLTIGWY